jgi:hypothetical protein
MSWISIVGRGEASLHWGQPERERERRAKGRKGKEREGPVVERK